jgi:drug/metabolite transporter (DMT)-like permease
VLYRPYLQKYPTLSVSAFAMFASVLVLAVAAVGEGFLSAPPHFTLAGWLAVGFIGLSSGVGYYLWLWALKHSTATSVSVFLALSPVSATIFGALALAEMPSPTSFFGLAGVALGIWLAQRP